MKTLKCFVKACEDVPVVAGIQRKSGEHVLACENDKWRLRPGTKVPLTEQTVIEVGVDADAVVASPEQLFLVCACGEAFSTLRIAYDHVCVEWGDDKTFTIQPESEAF